MFPGGSYVWFVRAVFDEDDPVDSSDWSRGRFFSVASAPSTAEVEHALEVLRRYANQEDGSRTSEFDPPASETRPRRHEQSSPRRSPSSPRDDLKSVPTATAAIKGSMPDATGETYGVVGISSSPDGAGVGAANTAGGPDLVLDGLEDGETNLMVSQSGVQRYSSGIELFNFSNPGSGEIDIYVEGWTNSHEFVGGGSYLTDVDADTLDGTDGAAFATDVEAAALVAVHAASADHDSRYYTETELATAGGGAVNWDNLTAMPAGFADGVDDDTTYSPGPGLIIDGGQIRIDPAAFSTRLSTLDSYGSVGWHTSIAIGADGLGIISYQDFIEGVLKVAHCADTACSSATTATLDSDGSVGYTTSIAIGADGLGIISYWDQTNGDLKVAHCANTACSTATTATLDSGGNVGYFTSIAIGADDLGIISYRDTTNFDLKVAHCDNTACSSATTATLDSGGDVGWDTSIAIGADGLGLVSYGDNTNFDLNVAHCANTACSSATTAPLDSGGSVGVDTSIAIGDDGLALISHHDFSNGALKAAHLGIGVP